ncbi:exopolyphosphatase [Algimonas arctica]|uniref:Exopolyphosphatase n=1 Tax=Algimonas arctica TaxID=1479486 RepID=A0A8J3CUV1_9PROT|nr:Ppx/GppA phosphatase family protein [Algimonas arctica]GHB03216.1 exopolyphosphatase [Algimonas arctica]
MPDNEPSGSVPEPAPEGSSATEKGRGRARRQNNLRRTGPRSGGNSSRTFAALDLGTNNCRLLIARETSDGFRIVDSYSKVVRLGYNLAHTGALDEASMDAAVEALKVCARKMKAKHVKRWRCVATEACRRASNGDFFLDRVKKETGISLEVISPRVESRLAVMGCVKLVDPTKDVALVIDIGGGSTELSWVDVRKLRDGGSHRLHRPPISAWCSLPLGVVTLSDKVPEHADREAWYADMKETIRQAIREQGADTRFVRAFEEGRGHLIGTSGTITSLAGIHLKLPYYQRNKVDGLWLRSHDAVTVARDMASRSPEDRAKEPCIGEDRARMLVAGCAIIDVVCEMWPSKMIRVADRGLREGMLIGLIGAGRIEDAQASTKDAAE